MIFVDRNMALQGMTGRQYQVQTGIHNEMCIPSVAEDLIPV